jgi:hypothetical protein
MNVTTPIVGRVNKKSELPLDELIKQIEVKTI